MFPLEFSYHTTAGADYSNKDEAQEKYIKTNYMKKIEVLKEKMNKSFKEVQ